MSDRIQAGAANRPTALGAIVLVSVTLGGVAPVPAALAAQEPWPLQPTSRTERVIAPFLEGWYLNDDQTITYSFGYLNMNEETVEIPIGEGNSIEPGYEVTPKPAARALVAYLLSLRQPDIVPEAPAPKRMATSQPKENSQ